MKKEYIAPALAVESVVIADSAVASYTIKDCVEYDGVTDTISNGSGGGYVYVNNGVITYCNGFGF